jgi:GWxTD domain-containing protein
MPLAKFKWRNTVFATVFLAILTVGPAYSQETETESPRFGSAPMFDIDAVNMASENPELSRLDLYIKITNAELQFIKTEDDKFRAEYEISAVVYDNTGGRVDEKIWKEQVIANNLREAYSIRLFGVSVVNFTLPPNEYQISVGLQDLETQRTGHQKVSILLRDFSSGGLLVSDILYLDYLSIGKNGRLNIRPKVSSEKRTKSKLYAYFEIYNIPRSDSAKVFYEIVDPQEKTFQENEYWITSDGLITQDFIEINENTLPHGQYKMKIKITYRGDSVSVERPFKWYLEGLPVAFSDIKEAIEVLKYIASKEELKKLKKVDKEKQHEAFLKFWELHDPTPGTRSNELKDEYYRRIVFANKNFSGFREGWKTDMGMVYVKLGPPDSIERNPYNQSLANLPGRTIKALEVWVYYKYNRQLIFLDENGFGDYRLANLRTFYDIIKYK